MEGQNGRNFKKEERDVPSKRPSLPCKNYSHTERSLTSHPTKLSFSLKKEKGRRHCSIL